MSPPANSGQIRWLKRELPRWQEAGILSAEQAGRILSLYAEQRAATESFVQLFRGVLVILGAALIGTGSILWFAAIWPELSPWARIGLVVTGLITAQMIRVSFPLFHTGWIAREIGELGSAILLGLAIFQTVRNLPLDIAEQDLLLVWVLGLLVPLWLLRAESVGILFATLISLWATQGIGLWYDAPNLSPLAEQLRFYLFLLLWVLGAWAHAACRLPAMLALAIALAIWMCDLPQHWPPWELLSQFSAQAFLLMPLYYAFTGACLWSLGALARGETPGWVVFRPLGFVLVLQGLISVGSFSELPFKGTADLSAGWLNFWLWQALLAMLAAGTVAASLLGYLWQVKLSRRTEPGSGPIPIKLWWQRVQFPIGWILFLWILFLLRYGAVGGPTLLPGLIVGPLQDYLTLAASLLSNIGTIILALAMLRRGVTQGTPFLSWIGVGTFLIWIIARFGDLFGLSLQGAAAVFLIAGVLLPLVGYLLRQPRIAGGKDTASEGEPTFWLDYQPKEIAGPTRGIALRHNTRLAIAVALATQLLILGALGVWAAIESAQPVAVVEIPVHGEPVFQERGPLLGWYLLIQSPLSEIPLPAIRDWETTLAQLEQRHQNQGKQASARTMADRLRLLARRTIYFPILATRTGHFEVSPRAQFTRPEQGIFLRGTTRFAHFACFEKVNEELKKRSAEGIAVEQIHRKYDNLPECWQLRVAFPFERFYVSENQRQEWATAVEKGKVRIRVAVFPSGRAYPLGLVKD
jgi:uncharacterized membrane protein